MVIAHQNNEIFKDIGYMLFDSYTMIVGYYFTMIDAVRFLTASYRRLRVIDYRL